MCIISGHNIKLKLPENEFMEAMNLCENDVVFARFKSVFIDREMIKQFFFLLSGISKEYTLPFILDLRQINGIQPDALAYLWSDEHNENYLCAAYIVDRKHSPSGNMIHYSAGLWKEKNVYDIKFRIFDNKDNIMERAEKWLLKQYDKDLLNRLARANDTDLMFLTGIFHQKTGLEIAETFHIPYSTISKKKANFTKNRFGEINLFKISRHILYIHKVRQKMNVYERMIQNKNAV